VFEQDLLAIRAKNRPTEPPIATDEGRAIDELLTGHTKDETAVQTEAGPSGPSQDEDHVMEDLPTVVEQAPPQEPMKTNEDDAIIVDTSHNPKVAQPATTDDKPHNPGTKKPEELEAQNAAPAPTEQLQEEVPMSAVTQDLNFDSMFDAPEGDATDINTADLDFLNNFKVDSVPDGAAGNTDLNSLLPGLESYANATNDDFTMVFPPTTGMNSDGAGNISKPTQSIFDGMDMSNDLPAQETNFDDLFLDGGDLGNAGNADDFINDGFGEIGEFDETLFNDLS